MTTKQDAYSDNEIVYFKVNDTTFGQQTTVLNTKYKLLFFQMQN